MASKIIAGRYELLEKIGDGGMAIVYKAKCRLLNRYVALKILKPEFTKDEKFLEHFRKESHAAASLSHPNIVSIYDVGKEGNIHYIVMELVEGRALSDIIEQEGPCHYRKVIDIAKQIATGLDAAHKKGIIHRDIKPHNILVTKEGIAKIADFGIAKGILNTTLADDPEEKVMGSVHYFSPEQARGSYVDEKSDLYSLGIVMYEMVTGMVPYDGENPVAVALKHIHDPLIPPGQRVEGIPPGLEKIILKLTDKYQSNRYGSAGELIEALDDIEFVTRVVGTAPVAAAGGEGVEANAATGTAADSTEPSPPKNKGAANVLSNQKRKFLIIAAAVVALVLIALGIALVAGAFDRETVEVPQLKGLTYEEAEELLEEYDLKIKEGDYVYSKAYDVEEIVSQDPKAGAKVKKGATITVNISKGSTEGTVPNLIGKSKKEAEKIIEEFGFEVGDIIEKTDTAEKNQVIAQDPDGGTQAEIGSKISITISDGKGKEKGIIPNLLGLTEDEAKNTIENAGFVVGKISYNQSDTYAKDKVMDQSQEPGENVDKGTKIDFVISMGPQLPVDLHVDFAQAQQDVFYMTITVSDENGTRNIVSNEQRNKADGGEDFSIEGKGKGTITVIFDNVVVMDKTVNFRTGEIS